LRTIIALRRICCKTVGTMLRRRSAAAVALRRIAPSLLLQLVTAPAIAGDWVPWIHRDPAGLGLLLPGRLWVSGDVTLAVGVPEGGPALGEIDDAILLARWEPLDRLALFGQLRVEDLLEVIDGEDVQTGNANVVIDRLYAEVLLTPRLSLRIGKIFTPFGLWNSISRAPLTWTVEEPAVTDNVFPRRATGLDLLFQTTWRGWTFDATTYGPAQDQLSFRRGVDQGDRSGLLFGGRVAAGRDLGPAFASLGVNAAGFRSLDRADWKTATGLDLAVEAGGHQITGEFTYRVPTAGGRAVHGLYLQDAIPLFGNLYGVLRFEYFQPPRGRAAVGQLVGLFWRPVPNVIAKADYLFGTRRVEDFQPGFHASLSLLF
jgi:hypothetical protein